jgi:hypothetical protein
MRALVKSRRGEVPPGGVSFGRSNEIRWLCRWRRIDPGEKIRGHKLSLPDAVFERLELTAIKRKSTVSAIGTCRSCGTSKTID